MFIFCVCFFNRFCVGSGTQNGENHVEMFMNYHRIPKTITLVNGSENTKKPKISKKPKIIFKAKKKGGGAAKHFFNLERP